MIASRRELVAPLLALVALLAAGCAASPGLPAVSAIEPLARRAPRIPDDVDRTLHDAAAATLRGDTTGIERAVARLDAIDAARAAQGETPSTLAALARDGLVANVPRRSARRAAARKLLARDDVDVATRARLEEEVADDPIELAAERLGDARWLSFGRRFNALVEPAGRSLSSPVFAAVGMFRSILGLAVQAHLDDELSVPERQALAQWRRFVTEEPDAPERAVLEERIEGAQAAWDRTMRDRRLRDARSHLRSGRSAAALVSAQRALAAVPEDREALALRGDATQRLRLARVARARTVEPPPLLVDAERPEARALVLALLLPGADVAQAATDLERSLVTQDDVAAPVLHDVAHFVQASVAAQQGHEDAARVTLDALAETEASPMARHARALRFDPASDPFDAFERAVSGDRGRVARFVFLGPLASGARERDLPRPVEWIIEAPASIDVVLGLPSRVLQLPLVDDKEQGRSAATHARRYLAMHPRGEHATEVRDWLVEHEDDRGNAASALAVARAGGVPEPELAPLRERAAQQMLEGAQRERRRDARLAFLRATARDYAETGPGREAGRLVREQTENASPQHVRVSRGWLQEHRALAGVGGFGLRPELIDGRLPNGELHPDGVKLLGGRFIELAFVEPGGDEDEPALTKRERLSEERMARVTSLLEETARREALIDPDRTFVPDADRDRFFEQIRLGVDTPDLRATAESGYAFESARERFGLVRGRESILPVDLVLQGSFPQLALGAFPRVHLPKPTADALLYR